MASKVRCILCLNKEIEVECFSDQRAIDKFVDSKPFDLFSSILTKNPVEEMTELGKVLLAHLQLCHPEEIAKMLMLGPQFQGFLVMRLFEAEANEKLFEQQKEEMRDTLIGEVMLFIPDDEEDEEILDEDGEEDETELEIKLINDVNDGEVS